MNAPRTPWTWTFVAAAALAVAFSGCGSSGGGTPTVPPSANADLAALAVSTGALSPAFAPAVMSYGVGPGLLDSQVTVTPTAAAAGSTITVDGAPVTSGTPSAPIPLPFGSTPVSVVVTASDGVTVATTSIQFTRTSLAAQEAYVKASNTEANDKFGRGISISGDTIVVGAYEEDSNAAGVNGDDTDNSAGNSGAAYVFVRSGTTWTQQAYLKASNSGTGDRFGDSVAIDGDTIVVGAAGEDSSTSGVNGNEVDDSMASSGAAYVFVRNGTTWTQQAYLKASNPDALDEFGYVVGVSGDTIVASAYLEDSCATGVNGNEADNTCGESGAAYVFVRSGTTWSQQAYLKASNTDVADIFGFSISVSGDTVAVGAQKEQSNATGVNGNEADDSLIGAGAVYVFTRSGTTWSQQAYVKASNTGFADSFGFSVSVDGDTLVSGAFNEDSSTTGLNGNEGDNSLLTAGAAYVFTRTGTTWIQQTYVKASNTDAQDRFAYSLALDGDTLAVSSYEEDSSATGVNGLQTDNSALGSGAVYVLR